jgi:hypothetical protein
MEVASLGQQSILKRDGFGNALGGIRLSRGCLTNGRSIHVDGAAVCFEVGPAGLALRRDYGRYAMQSISTRSPSLGSFETSTVVRAGR